MSNLQHDNFLGLYFNGKNDKMLEDMFEDGKYHQRVVEECISMISKPES